MGDSVENCLSLNGTEKLIQVPTGCAEQTMVKMAPTVYAIEYLDASEQWKNFNPERKDEAIKMIEKGTQEKKTKTKKKQHRDQQTLALLSPHIVHLLLLIAEGVSIVLTQSSRNAIGSLQTDRRNETSSEEDLGG